MFPIFYIVGAAFIYAAGQVTAPKPNVVLIKDGSIVEQSKMKSPVLVISDNETVQVRGAKEGISFRKLSFSPTPGMEPFHRDMTGEWAVDCQTDCEE